jgi:hypothetical protein
VQITTFAFAESLQIGAYQCALSLVFSLLVFGLANKNYGSVAGKTDDAVGETVSLTSWRADWEA